MMQLNVFDICREGVHVLGPGNRYVIWVQGCEQHCAGCITPESQPTTGGMEIDCKDIAADIILADNIDGITISGGEPFLQPEALCFLIDEVRKYRPDLNVIIYTGYKFEYLSNNPHTNKLVAKADLIIDGPYVEALNDGRGIRGSSNQEFHAITPVLEEYIEFMKTCERRQINVLDSDGNVNKIGVPSRKQ